MSHIEAGRVQGPPAGRSESGDPRKMHRDALAHLIVRAAKNTQLWITTHSQTLADRIENLLSRRGFCAEKHSGVPRVRLCMSDGETQVSKNA